VRKVSRDMARAGIADRPAARILLSLSFGVLGLVAGTSAAHATALTVAGPALYYTNFGPLPAGAPLQIAPAPGAYIAVSADTVIPNGNAATNGVRVATSGLAATTNFDTGNTITYPINYVPTKTYFTVQ